MSISNLHALRRERGSPIQEGDASESAAGRRSGRLSRLLSGSPYTLPVALLAGFFTVFIAVSWDRFVPALEVPSAPVLAVRAGADAAATENPAGDSTVVAAAARGASPMLFQATGWVEPDPLPIKATALVGGVVREVHVLEGQTVKAGDLLATLIDDDANLNLRETERKRDVLAAQRKAHHASIPSFQADIAALEKRIVAAEALLADAEDSADRYKSLESGSASDREIRKAELKATAERAVLAALEAQKPALESKLHNHQLMDETFGEQLREAEVMVDRAKLDLERTRIHSPVDGIILKLLVVPGQKRMLDMDMEDSATVAVLYEPDKLQVRVDVPLAEAAGLAVGQPAEVTCDLLPDVTFAGTVTRIAGEADLQRNTLEAKVRIEDPDPRLRPQMLCRVKFFAPVVGTSPAADGGGGGGGGGRLTLFVPRAAVVDPAGGSATVWVVSPGSRAERRTVTLGGETRDDHVSVTAGVRPGERLVTGRIEKLAEGRRVRTSS